MKPNEIPKLTIGNSSLVKLLLLPPPEKNIYKGLRLTTHYNICDTLYKLWRLLLVENIDLPNEVIDKLGDFKETDNKFNRVLLPIMAYYDYSCNVILDKELSGTTTASNKLIAGFNINSIGEFIKQPTDNFSSHKAIISILSYHYFTGKTSLYFLTMFKHLPFMPSRFIDCMQGFVHSSTLGIFSFIFANPKHLLNSVAEKMLIRMLADLKDLFEPYQNIDTHSPGIYSSLNLEELVSVAHRKKTAVDKYGRKQIEKYFEQQLSLLVQSLGFFVIPARSGQKKADLFCFYSDGTIKFSFLLEAKTKSSNYNLPQNDIRAIKEYAIVTRATLTFMPDLKFVLIVGPKPSRNISEKLKLLESEINIKVRYMDIKHLVKLRENLPGPINPSIFLKTILNCNYIINDETIKSISDYFYEQQKLHAEYLDKYFNLGSLDAGFSNWPSHS